MPSTELSIYDNAKHWVAQYESVDDVKEFIDKAAAITEYARRANDFELEIKATRARVRAERKCGELLREQKMAVGARGSGSNQFKKVVRSKDKTAPKTLSQMGITKDQSSRYQKLANISEERFEETLTQVTNAAGAMGKITTNSVLNAQKPRNPAPRLNTDALWLWGTLKDFEELMQHQDKDFLLNEMTPVMRPDVERIIPKLSHWLG